MSTDTGDSFCSGSDAVISDANNIELFNVDNSKITQMTEREQLKISILSMLNMDVFQSEIALQFINDSSLKQQLFVRCFNQQTKDATLSDRVSSAIESAESAMKLFD